MPRSDKRPGRPSTIRFFFPCTDSPWFVELKSPAFLAFGVVPYEIRRKLLAQLFQLGKIVPNRSLKRYKKSLEATGEIWCDAVSCRGGHTNHATPWIFVYLSRVAQLQEQAARAKARKMRLLHNKRRLQRHEKFLSDIPIAPTLLDSGGVPQFDDFADAGADGDSFCLFDDEEFSHEPMPPLEQPGPSVTPKPRRLLWLGMTQHPNVAPLDSIYKAFGGKKIPDATLRDTARCRVAMENGAVSVYTMGLDRSTSNKHFSIDMSGYGRHWTSIVDLPLGTVDEIAMDPTWMPSSYVSEAFYNKSFFQSALWHFGLLLSKDASVFLPTTPELFQWLVKVWEGHLDLIYECRFLTRQEAADTIDLVRFSTDLYLDMPALGKEKVMHHLGLLELSWDDLCGEMIDELCPSLKDNPPSQDKICFLGLKKRPGLSKIASLHWTCSLCTSPNLMTRRCMTCWCLPPRRSKVQGMVLSSPRNKKSSTRTTTRSQTKSRWDRCEDSSSDEEEDNKDENYEPPTSEDEESEEEEDNSQQNNEGTQLIPSVKLANQLQKERNLAAHFEMLRLDPPKGSKYAAILMMKPASCGSTIQVAKLFKLDQLKKTGEHVERIVCVQKPGGAIGDRPAAQLVMYFGLKYWPHGIVGPSYLHHMVQELGVAPPQILSNTQDWMFDEADPNKPVVLNTDSTVPGFSSTSVVATELKWIEEEPFGKFPDGFFEMTAIDQFVSMVRMGIQEGYMKEWLQLCSLDARMTVAFHLGANVKNGRKNGWKSVNKSGYGISLPGVYKYNTPEELSFGFRQWVLGMGMVVNHLVIYRTLVEPATSRMDQCSQKHIEEECLSVMFNLLAVPQSMRGPDNVADHRPLHAGTLQLGDVCFHIDHLNPGKSPHDNVNLGTVRIDNWSEIIGDDTALKKLFLDNGIGESAPFAFLCYPREIQVSVSDAIRRARDVKNPVARRLCHIMDSDDGRWFDMCGLADDTKRAAFEELLVSTKRTDSALYRHDQPYSKIQEGGNRDVLLFNLVYVWMRVVQKFSSQITRHHAIEVVTFVFHQVNGAPLGVEAMQLMLLEKNEEKIRTVLKSCRRSDPESIGSLQSLLCTLVKTQLTGIPETDRVMMVTKVTSSKGFRWQNFDRSLFGDASRLLVLFVSGMVDELQQDIGGASAFAAVVCMTSKEDRSNLRWCDEKMQAAVSLGSVKGTFGVQLLAAFDLIPVKYMGWARLEKGTSGFYLFMERVIRESANDGTTFDVEGMRTMIDEAKKELAGKDIRIYLSLAVIDQLSCRENRRGFFKSVTEKPIDGRKYDYYFWHTLQDGGLPFLPMRAKDGQIQFWIATKWHKLHSYWCMPDYNHPDDPIQVTWAHGDLLLYRNTQCKAAKTLV